MAIQFQNRRGTVSENNNFTGAAGEVVVDTTNNRLRVHDGATAGGHPVGDFVNVKDFGAIGNGTADDTAAIQDALDYLDTLGGGICYLPSGTYYISIAESYNANACLTIPANVIFKGDGVGATIIQRLPSERGVDGVLICNKYWDTNGGYTAAGNIVFEDFTITDGAASPQRGSGDLIGLGHADNVTVQRVHAGTHDQHFVDICGSKRVKVLNCTGYNEHAGSYNGSATVQVDGVAAGAIRGIYVDSTVTTDCEIANNHFINKTTTVLMHVGHKAMLFENINIHNNVFDGGYNSGDRVIASDTNPSFKNLKITNNTIIPNNHSAYSITFYIAGTSSETIHNVVICNNNIKGNARTGIYFGSNLAFTGSSYPDYNNIVISNNTIDIDAGTQVANDIYGIAISKNKSILVNNNSITIRIDTDNTSNTLDYSGIKVEDNRTATIDGNNIELINDTTPVIVAITSGIKVEMSQYDAGPADLIISNNNIKGDGFKYLLNYGGSYGTRGKHNVTFSTNSTSGDTSGVTAYIYEKYPSSDGSNFRKQVDFGSGTYIKTIASGNFYTGLPLPGKKKWQTDSVMSPAKIELYYSPNSSTAFDSDAEKLKLVYLSSTECAGTQIVDIDQINGNFAIITGISGVSCVINNSTFQPVIRTSGYIQAFASI